MNSIYRSKQQVSRQSFVSGHLQHNPASGGCGLGRGAGSTKTGGVGKNNPSSSLGIGNGVGITGARVIGGGLANLWLFAALEYTIPKTNMRAIKQWRVMVCPPGIVDNDIREISGRLRD